MVQPDKMNKQNKASNFVNRSSQAQEQRKEWTRAKGDAFMKAESQPGWSCMHSAQMGIVNTAQQYKTSE